MLCEKKKKKTTEGIFSMVESVVPFAAVNLNLGKTKMKVLLGV